MAIRRFLVVHFTAGATGRSSVEYWRQLNKGVCAHFVIERNGEIQAMGASAAVLNHPAQAIVMLVRHLAHRGQVLPAGSFVMTGGITEAIPVSRGDNIVARFQDMGSVSFRFV